MGKAWRIEQDRKETFKQLDENKDRIMKLINSNWTDKAIANYLGITACGLRSWKETNLVSI